MAKATQLGTTGRLGEKLALKWLKSYKYSIKDTNVTYKFGEIDIVALKGNAWHFIEVKSAKSDSFTPISLIERIDPKKLKRLTKSVEMYVHRNNLHNEKYQIDAILVRINTENKKAEIELISNLL